MGGLMLNIKSKEYETMVEEMKSGKEVVITPWGKAKIDKRGYYIIIDRKIVNNKFQVHSLIWKEFYGKNQPEGYHIHHKDGNKLNNDIQNLQCCESSKHNRLHSKGENNPMSNKHHTIESKKKMSLAKNGLYDGENNPRAKYGKLWDIRHIQYIEWKMFRNNREPNPCKCFKLKYNGKYVDIGYFHDFVSVEIINDLIREMIE